MNEKTIMVVEDDRNLQTAIKIYLEKEGYRVLQAFHGAEALTLFSDTVSLILLDVMMPYVNGWELCEQLRSKSNVPIIMLTARSREEDKLRGFDLGVDDYVTKPFSLKELAARIKVVLKRLSQSVDSSEDTLLIQGGIVIDLGARTANLDDKPVDFVRKEFDLLVFFMRHPNQVFTREQLLFHVWEDRFVEDRTVDTHIKQIREKLGNQRDIIKTVWGVGYRFVPPVEKDAGA